MITVKFVGGPVVQQEFSEGMTAGDLVQSIKNEHEMQFAQNQWTLQDSKDGHQLAPDYTITDGRLYFLNAWVVKAS